MDKETQRQIFHLLIGLAALFFFLHFGRRDFLVADFFLIIIGTLLINARILGKKIFFVDWFMERFERNNAPFPGWGSACYATGVLIIVSFLSDPSKIAASILLLALGDAVSTIVGRAIGKHPIPYNKSKSIEGSAAFFISSLSSFLFMGYYAFALAFIGAFSETLPLGIDDNILIPVACTIFFLVIS